MASHYTRKKRKRRRRLKPGALFLILILIAALAVGLFIILGKKGGNGGLGIISGMSGSIRINELMTSNKDVVADDNGDYHDWIELYNPSNQAVDLSGYGMSDNLSDTSKYVFPENTVVEANSYLVVWCSGQENTDALHTPFKLSEGESLVVVDPKGNTADSIKIGAITSGCSYGLNADGSWVEFLKPTPGAANDSEVIDESFATNMSGLYISEMMGINNTVHKASDNQYYDWVELHNGGSEAINLKGYSMTDNTNTAAAWTFPDVTIQPNEYLIVYASETDGAQAGDTNALHANFKINGGGDTVFLFDAQGTLVDRLEADTFMPDVSCGRGPNAETLYYTSPTPSAENASGSSGITNTPKFSTEPGIYDSKISVELTVPEGETVHYTTDCTTPTESSPAYNGPIALEHNTVIRAVSVRDGYITGYTNTGTFLFKDDEVNHSLPVVTLVTDPDNLWNQQTGIYAMGDQYDPSLPFGEALSTATFYQSKLDDDPDKWERAGVIEVFDQNGTQVFSQNVGIRLAGSFGRGRAQKGFNISARSEYGDNRLKHPFFENRDFTDYKAIVLRAGGQDQNRSKIRDELATGLLEGTDVNVINQAYKPYVLYLNGEYWGVYFMKEKRNRFFVAQHEGTTNTDDMDIGYASTRVSYGSNDDWKELMTYIKDHDLSNNEHYKHVESKLDVNSFMDYMICEIYVGNSDYGNIQYYKLPDGKWKWIYYDFCWGFTRIDHQTLSLRRGSQPAASDLFNALLKNAEWKDAFIRRFAQLMKTVYAPDRVNALIDELYSNTEPEIARERKIFNQATFRDKPQPEENYGSYDSYVSQIQLLRDFANKRPAEMKAQIQKEFGLSDDYMTEVFG